MVKISYDVQGDWTRKELYSNPKNNNVKFTQIVVKDKWNLGRKTRVFYDYRVQKTTTSLYEIKNEK